MSTQLKVFEEDAADDWADLLDHYEGVQFDMDDEMECCFFIRNQLQSSSAAPYFLSILQHLCLVRDDHVYRFVLLRCQECSSNILALCLR